MHLNFKFPDGKEHKFSLNERTFIIGRSQKCAVVLPYDSFSRQHCLVEVLENDTIYLTDLESVNGVFINNTRIEPKVRVGYPLGANLTIGEVAVKIDTMMPTREISLEDLPDPAQGYAVPRVSKAARNPVIRRPKPETMALQKNPIITPMNLGLVLIIILSVLLYRHYTLGQLSAAPKALQSEAE